MARETWVQSQVESYQRLKKMILDASLLNTQHYKVRIKGKVEQSREGVAPSPTHWCSSYRKGSVRATLDYGRQLYLLTLHRMFITHIGIPKQKKKHLRLLSSGMKLFITFEFFDIRREIPSFNADLSICLKPHAAPAARSRRAPKVNLLLRRQKRNSLVRTQELNSLTFLKSQPTLSVREVTNPLVLNSYLGFLFWHLWMTRPLRVRVNTCVHVEPN